MSDRPHRPGDRLIRRTIVKPERVVVKPPRRFRLPVHPPLLLAMGFLAVILVGSLLLSLPVSNRSGGFTPYMTALFTATSAVCVTGLVVVDTETYWSPFGQAVILLLVQVGGLGFMTGSTLLLILIGRRISLTERMLIGSSHGILSFGGVIRLSRQIVLVTALIEAAGALVLFLRFSREIPLGTALWMGIFHSVSAFNNSGFDLVGNFRSLTPYSQDPIIPLTVVILVILGGIGYTVLLNVTQQRAHRYLLLDTKLVLVVTIALLATGTAGFLVIEHANQYTLGGMSPAYGILNAFFMAASFRTAGFSTVDVAQMREGSLFLTMALMAIGGAAGSTAGGIKVGTFGVLIAAVISSTRGSRSVTAFGNEIPLVDVARALSVVVLYLGLIFLITLILTLTEPFSLTQIMFETTSAFGTVGLSTGITPDLSLAGELLIIMAMYVGRIGALTVALALAQRSRPETYKFPEAHVRIG